MNTNSHQHYGLPWFGGVQFRSLTWIDLKRTWKCTSFWVERRTTIWQFSRVNTSAANPYLGGTSIAWRSGYARWWEQSSAAIGNSRLSRFGHRMTCKNILERDRCYREDPRQFWVEANAANEIKVAFEYEVTFLSFVIPDSDGEVVSSRREEREWLMELHWANRSVVLIEVLNNRLQPVIPELDVASVQSS